MVGNGIVTSWWTSLLSILVTNWTTIGISFPIVYGVNACGTIGCSGTGYACLGT